MGRPLYTNNAASALAAGITSTQTTIQVQDGMGNLFPTPVGGDYFYVTLTSISIGGAFEIMQCTARSGDTMTVVRGVEGTSAQSFNIGDNVQLRITAAGMNFLTGQAVTSTEEEAQTATQGQTVFTLVNFDYSPGTNNLAVFVNGSKQVSGVNYSETNVNTITFNTGLNAGDIVEFLVGISVASGTLYANDVLYNEGGTGAVTRTLETKLQETISVKDFGAVGDGVTDDTTAILNCINNNQGNAIYFPSGTYIFNGDGLLSDPSTCIYGDGRGLSIIKKTVAGGRSFWVAGTGSYIRSMGFISTVTQDSTSVYVQLAGTECYIEDFEMQNQYTGIHITGAICRVKHGRMFDCSAGAVSILAEGGDATNSIDDVLLGAETTPNTATAGIRVRNSAALTITNSSVLQQGIGIDIVAADNTKNVQNLIVDNCYFDNCSYGIRATAYTTGCLTRLTFSNVWVGSASSGDNILLQNNGTGVCEGFFFINCQSFLSSGAGISIHGNVTGYLQDVNIIGGEYGTNVYGVYVDDYVYRLKIQDADIGTTGGLGTNTTAGILLSPNTGIINISNNNIVNNPVAINNASTDPSNLTIVNNYGYRTSNQGSVVIPSGSTSYVVTHNLGFTPNVGQIFLSLATVNAGAQIFPSSANSTTFTITLSPAPSVNIAVNWMIKGYNS